MIEKTVFKIIELTAGNTDEIFAFVNDIKTKYPKFNNDKLAKKVAYNVKKKCAIQGGLMAIPGAVPGVGSMIQIGISLFDFSQLIKNQVHLIFSIGYCYGISDTDKLKRVTLKCFGSTLDIDNVVDLRNPIGKKMVKTLSDKAIRLIIIKLQKALAKKFVFNLILKLIPFGIGIILGSISHWIIIRTFQFSSIKFFHELIEQDKSLPMAINGNSG
ncbi:hypothetical protein [Desulfobacula sp.]|uniref:hypothetical protein n=1 Tax=Desulfobacula sp. TaxID=2593537 RepID=UPI00262A5255|nr:hypothetical protein [Desulfobacula sp.]